MHKHKISAAGILIFFAISVSSPSLAQTICPLPGSIKPKGLASLGSFQRLAVAGEDRIVPVDSFARNTLERFSGKTSFDGKPAAAWLARLLFAPDTTRTDKVFFVQNPDVLRMLSLSPEGGARYSFSSIEPHLPKLTELAKAASAIEEAHRNAAGNSLLSLYGNIVLYTDLANSFAFAVPHPDFQVNDGEVVRLLGLPNGKNVYNFLDIALKAETIMAQTQGLDQKPMGDRTPQEKELLRLLGNLYQWSMYYENSAFRIVPVFDLKDRSLVSPWDVINTDFKNEEVRKEMDQLRNLVVAYWNGEQLAFDLAARSFEDSVLSRVDPEEARDLRGLNFELEVLNNQLNPEGWAKVFYGAALFLSVGFLLWKKTFLKYASLFWVGSGFIFNAGAAISYAVVTARSPFKDYHELFLAAGLMAVLSGSAVSVWGRKPYGLVLASACGLALLFLAGYFPGIF